MSDKESDSHWQQSDYKGFGPNIGWDNLDYSKAPAIQNMPVNSAICRPVPEKTKVKAGQTLKVQGTLKV